MSSSEEDTGNFSRDFISQSKRDRELFDQICSLLEGQILKIKLELDQLDLLDEEEKVSAKEKIRRAVEDARRRLRNLEELNRCEPIMQSGEKIAIEAVVEDQQIRNENHDRLKRFAVEMEGAEKRLGDKQVPSKKPAPPPEKKPLVEEPKSSLDRHVPIMIRPSRAVQSDVELRRYVRRKRVWMALILVGMLVFVLILTIVFLAVKLHQTNQILRNSTATE